MNDSSPLLRRLIALLPVIGLAACVEQDLKQNFSRPATTTEIVFDRDLSYTTTRGVGIYFTEILKACTYISEIENDTGVFYRGQGGCFFEEAGSHTTAYQGGIWLPKRSSDRPRIYYYLDANPHADAPAHADDLQFVPGDIDDLSMLSMLRPRVYGQVPLQP